ncbi:hypothetical protein F4820DRAFT_449131 [Hypoxylon rubiginosum]|uniref:Uncharacterized protein n=1 Tax=Hypoxylon rubiginosum TaxID=110542 RepID=A0ACB9YY50_9PEZI|nr:hypothetical protein F4820DRAFT_449131 [Hypoxylon rubiginosum]
MKSATIAAALLASFAVAQPHGHKRHHHEKRDLVTEWETVWETATVVIDDDSTQTIGPSPKETSSGSPGQFFQPDAPSSSSIASSVVETPVVETPVVETPVVETPEVATAEAVPQTYQTTPTTTVSLAQATTYSASSSPTTLATTTTQAAPAPPTTTAEAVTPTTTTYAAASPPASSTGSSSGSTGSDGIPYSQEFSGEITYYNAALGACGYEDSGKDDSENIVAIPKDFWDNISSATSYGLDQPAHPLCDKTITITAPDGTTAKATIRDRCVGCVGHAIDVTPKAFTDLFGSLEGGRLDCSWEIDE